MKPFSYLKKTSSKDSSIASNDGQSSRSRLSMSSQSSAGTSYYVQFPYGTSLSPSRSSSSQKTSSTKTDIAEMMDDDNIAWGKPRKPWRR
ncbi:unnamed protein product [Somion occarium]|uniref:Uncharacterized protein n=1 Tax=Somion occarium TaxID=3059160 RepID=A0ABP1CPE8_9APHY